MNTKIDSKDQLDDLIVLKQWKAGVNIFDWAVLAILHM